MKYKINKYVLGMLVFTFVFTSCSKNEDALATVQSNKQDILIFSTEEEFNETLAKVNAMTKTERNGYFFF